MGMVTSLTLMLTFFVATVAIDERRRRQVCEQYSTAHGLPRS